MRACLVVVAALGLVLELSACGAVVVEVSKRHEAPRPLAPRTVETLKTYQARPPGGVAVYGMQATGDDVGQVESAVRQRAALLGCDGIMFTVREEQSTSQGVSLTGKLIEAREYVMAHIDALCMVDPAQLPYGCPAPKPEPAAVATTAAPADAEATARSMLEQWRQAYEARSSDALARLYAHDASLSVIDDGAVVVGWAAFEPVLRERLGRGGAMHVRVEDVQVHAAGATAVIVATVRRDRSDGNATTTEAGGLTLVLRSAETGWVIVAEHFSFKHG